MQRPYLLRAMHEWMTDNDLTPHIVVDAQAEGVLVPKEYAKDGKLVLNVSYSATRNLHISNEFAEFEARFGGVARHLQVPVAAILGIYARETGQGMIFSSEQSAGPAASGETAAEETAADEGHADRAPGDAGATPPGPEPGETGRPKRPRTKPDLKIIK